jgi:RNA recognition motif-containing protein
MGSRLYVGNISWNTSNEELTAHFAKYGEVKYAKVITDQATGRSKGFAFVEMSSDDEAQKAIDQSNGFDLGGREIRVSEAQERAPRVKGEGRFESRGTRGEGRNSSYETRGENRFGGKKEFRDRY